MFKKKTWDGEHITVNLISISLFSQVITSWKKKYIIFNDPVIKLTATGQFMLNWNV